MKQENEDEIKYQLSDLDVEPPKLDKLEAIEAKKPPLVCLVSLGGISDRF